MGSPYNGCPWKWLDAYMCPKFCPEIKLEMCAWRKPVIGHFGGHFGIFETFFAHSLLRSGRILIKFNNVRGTHPYCRIFFFRTVSDEQV